MKKRVGAIFLILSLLVSSVAFAQEQENFADSWTSAAEITETEETEMETQTSNEETFTEDIENSSTCEDTENDIEISLEAVSEENTTAEIEFSDVAQETEIIEETDEEGFTIFSSENADLLEAETEADKELIEEIEEGEIIAVAAAELASDEYRIYVSSALLYCDEVWDENAAKPTRYRQIEYVDSAGNTRKAPLYCMRASKNGIDPEYSGDDLKSAAISFLSNSTIKKILYFGYGGPGDICDDYDPTCEHVDWSKWRNRFIFTHQALSKTYADDVAGATATQIAHVGLNRFITKLKSMTIPNRSAMKIKAINTSGDTVTANPISVSLILCRTKPSSGYDWVESAFNDGFQITRLLTVVDSGSAGNGITVTRKTTDVWQLAYWKSADEVNANPQNPTILQKGKSISLKHGYRFRIVFPKSTTGTVKWTYPMSLLPVKYVMVDGDTQMGQSGYQDFGAYVYQGTRGTVTLNMVSQSTGTLKLQKTCAMTGETLSGASYKLYAAEDLYSGGVKRNNKDALIDSGTTDANGQLVFDGLLPGKYYVRESAANEGYLLDGETHSATVTAGKTVTLSLKNIPDIKAKVSIEKRANDTGVSLADAEFTLYSWDEEQQEYINGTVLLYDEETQKYLSETIYYTEDNKGKFQVKETKNPAGYTGSWSQDFALTEPGTETTLEYQAFNEPIVEKYVEILKHDSQTKRFLSGAEFVICPWNEQAQTYETDGETLVYDEEKEKYFSSVLEITESNQGKYFIEETVNPDGYMGSWQQEIDLNRTDQSLQFVVENDPIPKKYGKIKIQKTDVITGEILENAVFEIYQWDQESGTYEDSLGTKKQLKYESEEQLFVSEELELTDANVGKFFIKETMPPEGYTGAWEQEVVLLNDGEIAEYQVTNEPIQLPCGTITITKKIKESDIVWAHGNPTFPFVVEGADIRGEAHKYEDYCSFVMDGYDVDVNGYAVLQVTFSNIPIGSYRISEKSVLRYYLKEVIAESSNVSITNIGTPVYGKTPSEIMTATAEISLENLNGAVAFVNEKSRFDDYSHNGVVRNQVPIISGK